MISIRLYWGRQERALGAYLLTQGKSLDVVKPIKLDVFYPQEKIDAAAKAPFKTFIEGHLWDSVHKILAATAFYVTSSDSCLPELLKMRSLAQAFFKKLEFSFPISSFLYKFHIIDLTPVFCKFLHFFLDQKSVQGKGQNKTVEFWKEVVYRLGKWSQVLWMIRLFSVVCANPHLQQRKSVFFAAMFAFMAGLVTAVEPKPSRLDKLDRLSQQVKDIKWNELNTLQNVLNRLQTEIDQDNLSWDEKAFLYEYLSTELGKNLNETVYKDWPKDEIFSQKRINEETQLMKGFSAQGVFKKLFSPLQYRLEKARFSILLLGLNLRRLKLRVEQNQLTLEQAERVQDFLYLQTVENIQGKVTPHDLPICNFGENLLSDYRGWRKLYYLNQVQVNARIDQDPFFKPVFEMLPLIEKIPGCPLSTPLQLFFISLTTYLGKNTQRVPAIEHADGCHPNTQNGEDARLATNMSRHFQQYSNIPNAATKTFEEIITICRDW